MNTKSINQAYAFETRQRSVAPISATFQGRAVSMVGFLPAGSGATVAKPIGGTSATAVKPIAGTWHKPVAFGTTVSTDPRLRRTSPL